MLFLFHRRAKFSWLLRIQWRTSPMWHCWNATKGTLIMSTALLRWEHFALFWPWFFLDWPHLTWLTGLCTVSHFYIQGIIGSSDSTSEGFTFSADTATALFERFIFSYLDCSSFLSDLTVFSPPHLHSSPPSVLSPGWSFQNLILIMTCWLLAIPLTLRWNSNSLT